MKLAAIAKLIKADFYGGSICGGKRFADDGMQQAGN